MTPTIVSYYTADTMYVKEIDGLRESCNKLGLSYDLQSIPTRGSWSRNCCYKPLFLLEQLCKHQTPLVWTDADSVVVKRPALFDGLQEDFGICINSHLHLEHASRILTGTLFINNTKESKHLLSLWQEECEKLLAQQEVVWDQVALRNAIYYRKHKASIYTLPEAYCHIFDHPVKEDPVFVHYQASRLSLRAEQEVGLSAFFQLFDEKDLKEARRSRCDSDTLQ